MKVKVEADGGPGGTRVVTEGGRDIGQMVNGLCFRHEAGDRPTLEVSLCFVEAVIDCHAVMLGPNGKRVRRVEYEDGTVDVFGTLEEADEPA